MKPSAAHVAFDTLVRRAMITWKRAAGGALIASALLGCGWYHDPRDAAAMPLCRPIPRTDAPPAQHLVLIVNDTTRRDHVGAYGGSARTPHFDAFARANLLFRRAVAPAPWTKPSIASLFTGLYPSQHGVLDHPSARWRDLQATARSNVLPAELDTLAEVLQNAGFRTAAFVANPWMGEGFGFEQGFDTYDASFSAWDAPGEVISEAGLRWIASIGSGERFFLYLHYIDSHLPYGALSSDAIAAARERIEADDRVLTEEAEESLMVLRLAGGRRVVSEGVRPAITLLEMAYDQGLAEFDAALGAFLQGLAGTPGARETAVVVTSDHGEALFKRGYGNHARALFEDEVAIPLAVRLPGVEAAEITCPISRATG